MSRALVVPPLGGGAACDVQAASRRARRCNRCVSKTRVSLTFRCTVTRFPPPEGGTTNARIAVATNTRPSVAREMGRGARVAETRSVLAVGLGTSGRSCALPAHRLFVWFHPHLLPAGCSYAGSGNLVPRFLEPATHIRLLACSWASPGFQGLLVLLEAQPTSSKTRKPKYALA